MSEIPDYLKKAYELFKEEYAKHMAYFREQIENIDSVASNREEIYRRFHTIKGGAGFLDLGEVVSLAAEGEEIFRHSDYEESKTPRFIEIVELLEKEGKKI